HRHVQGNAAALGHHRAGADEPGEKRRQQQLPLYRADDAGRRVLPDHEPHLRRLPALAGRTLRPAGGTLMRMPDLTLASRAPGLDDRPLAKRVGLIILATDHTTEVDFQRMVASE